MESSSQRRTTMKDKLQSLLRRSLIIKLVFTLYLAIHYIPLHYYGPAIYEMEFILLYSFAVDQYEVASYIALPLTLVIGIAHLAIIVALKVSMPRVRFALMRPLIALTLTDMIFSSFLLLALSMMNEDLP